MNNTKPFFQDKGTRLYKGNCIDVLTTIPENTFDMIFADPPYFLPVRNYFLFKS